jgi:hypothetical protein
MSDSFRPRRPSIDDIIVLPRSDLEEAAHAQQHQQNMAQAALDQVGSLLQQADHKLTEIEDQGMLGTAIVRSCQDLADGIASLADRIDQQSHDDRRAMAQACLQDAQSSLLLMDADDEPMTSGSTNREDQLVVRQFHEQQLANLSEDQVMGAIQAAATLLRDVEASLKAIDQDEADELADVALTVAHLFVASLQSMHATLTPEHFTSTTLLEAHSRSNGERSGPRIDLLDSDDERDEAAPTNIRPPPARTNAQKTRKDRLRVLWPPLGPVVASSLDWGKQAASQQPLLAAALGMTLWPWAFVSAAVVAPVVLVDGLVQDLYGNYQDASIVQGVERTAAQVYQTGRLSFLCSKLMVRQTIRVASRQLKRHGGVTQIAQNAGEFALDRITHPVETACMVGGGVKWGIDKLTEAWNQIHDSEQGATVQRLQQ